MKQPDYYMVFDVESLGLHGQAFSVGYVVIDLMGREYDSAHYYVSPIPVATDEHEDWDWIVKNVPRPESTARHCDSMKDMIDLFWSDWMKWKDQGALLAADVPWPVEANFLRLCIAHDRISRKWQGPYPLLDVASVRFTKGLDPLATEIRLSRELPVHNPLADARQSARLLIEALNRK